METGSELSRTVAIFIVQKILLDDTGLNYICATYERFYAVGTVLSNMVGGLVEVQTVRLLKHVVRCFLRYVDSHLVRFPPSARCFPLPLFLSLSLSHEVLRSTNLQKKISRSTTSHFIAPPCYICISKFLQFVPHSITQAFFNANKTLLPKRLSDNNRAREALRQCLPEPLRDATFQAVLRDDAATKRCLAQLLINLSDNVTDAQAQQGQGPGQPGQPGQQGQLGQVGLLGQGQGQGQGHHQGG